MGADRAGPFVVDRWVHGDEFYGRRTEVAEILAGPRDLLWVVGTRRIGKTSLLRHVELLAEESEGVDVPLFCDLRGAESARELGLRFQEGLSAAAGRLEHVGLRPAGVEAADPFGEIGRARRGLRSRRHRLLLLCDGAEQLVRLGARDPVLLRKLRRTLQSGEGMRTVLASTPTLWTLTGQKSDTSPFLHGFAPPVPLQPLTEPEAFALIRQTQRPSGAVSLIDGETAGRMYAVSGGHPYLLQELGRRFLEQGEVEGAIEQLRADSTVAALFSSDLETLPQADPVVLGVVAETESADVDSLKARLSLGSAALKASLFRLESLGLVRRSGHDLTIGSVLLRRWLLSEGERWTATAARATEIVADLSRAEGPKAASPDDLFAAVYDPLRRLAGRYLRRERPGHTLQPTALVHEAYLKLIDQSRVDWKGRSHFFAVGARVMRRLLIDHARTRKRAKRGGDWLRVTLSGLEGAPLGGELGPAGLLALHAALEKLARHDERQARVVELRYFAGLKMSEVAEVLGVSKRTADADWARARAWLERELGAAR